MNQDGTDHAHFPETQWSLIIRAQKGSEAEASQAFSELCDKYYPAIRKIFTIKMPGAQPADVEEAMHAFLKEKAMHKNFLASVAKSEGKKFRHFIKGCIRNYIFSYKERSQKLADRFFPLDSENLPEPLSSDAAPDQAVDLEWARQVLANAHARLAEEANALGQGPLLEALRAYLEADPKMLANYREIGQRFGKTEAAVGKLAFYYRARLRWYITDEVRQTVSTPEALKEELDALFAAFAASGI